MTAEREGEQRPARGLGETPDGLGLGGASSQVDDGDAEVLAQRGREVALVDGAELDEQGRRAACRTPAA